MIVTRFDQVEPIDVGNLLGLADVGMTMRWLIHRGMGDVRYRHTFALRHHTVEPGKPMRLHSHKYVEAVYVLSGRVRFETDADSAELEPGDTLYLHEGEPHRGMALGGEPAAFLCVIDCIGGGENCFPQSGISNIKIEG